jgi:DNA-binding protein Fis
MDGNDDQKMEDELRKSVTKALRQVMRSLEQEPSVILEGEETGDVPDVVIEEIEAWLFRRRQENGDTGN